MRDGVRDGLALSSRESGAEDAGGRTDAGDTARASTSAFTRSELLKLFAAFAAIYVMLIPPGIIVIDGVSMFSVADSIATEFDLSVPCDVSGAGAVPEWSRAELTGRGGECYSVWYPLLPVLAAPFAAVGHTVADVAGVGGENVAQVFALIVPALAAAGAAVLTALLALRLGASRRGAVAAAVVFGFGTEALTYSRTFFTETLAALMVGLVVWGLSGTGRARAIGIAATALLVVTRPQLAFVGAVVGLALAVRERSVRPLIPVAAATAFGTALYLVYNWLRFADPLETGGASDIVRFSNFVSPGHIVETLGLFLVSPGAGLLWYSPVALLGAVLLWRLRHNVTGYLCLVGAVAVFLPYFAYIHPTGTGWGGRYLVAALPLLCAAIGTARRHVATAAVVLAAVALVSQIPALVGFYSRTYGEYAAQGVDLNDRRWSVRDSPVVSAWPAMTRQIRDARRTDVEDVVNRAEGPPPEEVDKQLLSQVIALWWWLLPAIGLPWWLGAALSAAVIAAAAYRIWKLANAPPAAPTAGA